MTDVHGCWLPDDRRYSLAHDVWLQATADGTVRLGLMSPLVAFMGIATSFSFRPDEPVSERGRSVGTVESVRFTGAVRLPLAARVIERNGRLLSTPRLLNDDPYGEGWVVRIAPVSPSDVDRYTVPAEATVAELDERIRRLGIRCWPRVPDVELVELGLECSAIFAKLDDELARRPSGSAVLLVTDDPTSPIEMVRYTDRTGHAVLAHRTEDDRHYFLVRKRSEGDRGGVGTDGRRFG